MTEAIHALWLGQALLGETLLLLSRHRTFVPGGAAQIFQLHSTQSSEKQGWESFPEATHLLPKQDLNSSVPFLTATCSFTPLAAHCLSPATRDDREHPTNGSIPVLTGLNSLQQESNEKLSVFSQFSNSLLPFFALVQCLWRTARSRAVGKITLHNCSITAFSAQNPFQAMIFSSPTTFITPCMFQETLHNILYTLGLPKQFRWQRWEPL